MTRARINKAIAHLGLEIQGNRGNRGDGYFYFTSLRHGGQVGESVMVNAMSHLSLERWVKEATIAAEKEAEKLSDAEKLRMECASEAGTPAPEVKIEEDKTYTLTFTVDELHAIGFALKQVKRGIHGKEAIISAHSHAMLTRIEEIEWKINALPE